MFSAMFSIPMNIGLYLKWRLNIGLYSIRSSFEVASEHRIVFVKCVSNGQAYLFVHDSVHKSHYNTRDFHRENIIRNDDHPGNDHNISCAQRANAISGISFRNTTFRAPQSSKPRTSCAQFFRNPDRNTLHRRSCMANQP